MSTVIPYTWTWGRQVLAWGSPAPTPGQWYLNTNDPSYSPGVTAVYLAVPFWLALDFSYSKDRNLLVLLSAPTDDGQRGRLRLYRGNSTAEPATLTEYTDLETNDVSGAALGVRGSGEVDVFYMHGGTLKHRLSKDGGETFGTATSHTLTGAGGVAFTPKEAAQPASAPNGFFCEAETLGGYVHFDYLAGGGIALIIHGRLTGGGGDESHIVKADWNAATSTWAFQSIGLLIGSTPSDVFPLRNGDLLLSNAQKVKALTNAGTFSLGYTVALIGGARPFGVSETMNQLLTCAGVGDRVADSDGSGPFYYRRMVSYALNSTQTAYAVTGSAAFPSSTERWKSWRATYSRVGTTDFGCRAGKFRLRSDRRWELIYLNRNQQPEIIRFPLVTYPVTPLAWY